MFKGAGKPAPNERRMNGSENMVKFKNKQTGAIEEPNSALVVAMYQNNPERFEEVNETPNAPNAKSYKELKEEAKARGLDFPSNIKRVDLEALLHGE